MNKTALHRLCAKAPDHQGAGRTGSRQLRVLPPVRDDDNDRGISTSARPFSRPLTGDEHGSATEAARFLLVNRAALDDLLAGLLAIGATAIDATETAPTLRTAPSDETRGVPFSRRHGSTMPAPSCVDGARLLSNLTARELGVFERMARGASNAEIASELFLSTTTVKTHVGSVLAKLMLRNRAEGIVFAYESGFVRPGNPPTRWNIQVSAVHA
jgi:DNA-binding CsgD family transcriptional regulator